MDESRAYRICSPPCRVSRHLKTDVLIIGGGLSGLALAEALQRQGRGFLLVEARDRLGGRIKSEVIDGTAYDVGPTWFWPGQMRIAGLIQRFGLQVFDQYAQGELSFEDAKGQVQRGRGFASMEGSWRLRGGLGLLIDHLAAALPPAQILLDREVTALSRQGGGVRADLIQGSGIDAAQVVLALPPRIAAKWAFDPSITDQQLQFLNTVPTWMAGQAKGVALYERPFWREAGQSGDAMSQRGPLVEMHDASPQDGGPYAIFGFVGVRPEARLDQVILKDMIRDQLGRIFGPEAANPQQILLKDWASDPRTATAADQIPLSTHPRYSLPPALQGIWDGRLYFAGSEVAPDFGGYLEGALEAAENGLAALNQTGDLHHGQ